MRCKYISTNIETYKFEWGCDQQRETTAAPWPFCKFHSDLYEGLYKKRNEQLLKFLEENN